MSISTVLKLTSSVIPGTAALEHSGEQFYM